MYKRLFSLFLFGIGLYWLNACCGENKPYFDYQKLGIISDRLLLTATNDTVITLRVSPEDIDYFTSVCPNLPFVSSAYGNSCPAPGDEGTKFKMTAVEIFADKDFNDTLPAGTSLAGLFYDGRAVSQSPPVPQVISDLEFPTPDWDFVVYTPFKPKEAGEAFALTVKITKSDGSVAQGKISGVKFR